MEWMTASVLLSIFPFTPEMAGLAFHVQRKYVFRVQMQILSRLLTVVVTYIICRLFSRVLLMLIIF